MPNLVKDCRDVGTCDPLLGSWDQLFCICPPVDVTDSICTPAPGTVNDSVAGLVGVYSTTASFANTLPSTGDDTAEWANIEGALADDGDFATIQPATIPAPTPRNPLPNQCVHGTEYIALTGYGFSIPTDATIVGIAVGIKGYSYFSTEEVGGNPSPLTYGSEVVLAGGQVFNIALMLNGVPYYFADPGTVGYGTTRGQGISGATPCGSFIPSSGYTYVQGAGGDINGVEVPGLSTPWPASIDPLTCGGTPCDNAPVIVPMLWFFTPVGTLAPCDTPQTADLDVIAKNTIVPTLKTNWTPSEVNAETFGVAIAADQDEAILFLGTAGQPPNQVDSDIIQQVYVNLTCAGIAVYYIPGGGAPVGNPFQSFC